MTIKTIGMIAGIVPILNSSPAKWRFREGPHPTIEEFDVMPSSLRRLLLGLSSTEPVEILLSSGRRKQVIKEVWILEAAPTDNPHIARVRCADRRWMWPYGHILKRYNMRRNVGFRGIKRQDIFNLQDIVPDVWYARYSLEKQNVDPPSGKWETQSMLRDVLIEAGKTEKEFRGVTFPIDIDPTISKKVPVESLELDDATPGSVARAVGFVPEAGITCDANGAIRVWNKASGKQAAELKKLGRRNEIDTGELQGMGHIVFVDNRRTRPKAIRVLFTREVEVRFDHLEKKSASSTTTAVGDRRIVDNVLSNPDVELTIINPDGGGKVTVPQGTWVTFDQAMGTAPDNGFGVAPGLNQNLDHFFLQRAFIPFMDLFAALQLTGTLDPDADWPSRVAALQSNWRRTYAIPRRWWDQSLSVRAYRTATIDQVSGRRAPAAVYSDYALLGNQRTFILQASAGFDLSYAINVDGYPKGPIQGGVPSIEANTKLAPAEVAIIDHDQGIIRVDYKIDPYRVYDMILPSQLEVDAMPHGNIKNAPFESARPITFDSLIDANKPPRMTSKHRLAMIVTMVPAAPNDKRQLHPITVKPGDVRDLLPSGLQAGLSNAKGPVWEVRVGPRWEVARVGWKDSRFKDIEAIFGLGSPNAVPNLKGLVTNEDPAGGSSLKAGASLNQIARGIAARIYASLVDRHEGTSAGDMNSSVRLEGWMDQVTQEISPNGVASTKVSLPEKIPEMDFLAFLDSSTRAIIMRQPQPTP